MNLFAAHVNDAGILLLDSNKILYNEPGFALLDDEGLTTGASAYEQARIKPRRIQREFWSRLDTTPLSDSRFRHLTAADLVSRQLEQIWNRVAGRESRLLVAAPAYMGSENLGLLLGIARDLNIPIVGLVDAAVAATRRQYEGALPVHIDFSLHSATLSRIDQAGQARLDRTEIIEDCGILNLYDAWIGTISEAFVQQSRFDPLHTAETEQALYDKLQGWLASASTGTSVSLEIEYRGIRHKAEIDSLELIAAAAPIYHTIVSTLRALYRADETPALQFSDRAGRMPGLSDMLVARVGGEVFLLETGAEARGLLARWRDTGGDASSVNLLRQLPWDQAPVRLRIKEQKAGAGQPTHLLYENTAYELNGRPLTLGSQVDETERRLDLRSDMPGVSRRHCSVQVENGQCTLRDYSRYGTFLNGHKIDGSALLQLGDRIRLGTPGFELRLITMEHDSGS